LIESIGEETCERGDDHLDNYITHAYWTFESLVCFVLMDGWAADRPSSYFRRGGGGRGAGLLRNCGVVQETAVGVLVAGGHPHRSARLYELVGSRFHLHVDNSTRARLPE